MDSEVSLAEIESRGLCAVGLSIARMLESSAKNGVNTLDLAWLKIYSKLYCKPVPHLEDVRVSHSLLFYHFSQLSSKP